MVRALAKECRAYDVIICMSQKSFFLAALAKPFMRKPIVWFMNDLLSKTHFSKPLIFLMTKVFSRFANHIVLNSQASRNAWIEHGGPKKNASIIYPGTDVNHFTSAVEDTDTINAYKQKFSPDGKPLIGIFGRLTPWKGQDIFLKTIAKIPYVNAVLVGASLFGEENHKASLKAQVKDLNLEDRVTFAGHIEDVPKAMAACDVITHCSTAAEPFGLVIVEAMLSGTPVIASDGGGAREIVIPGETGQRTPIGNSKALSEAIQKYLDNPQWTKKIVHNAYIRAAEEFSNDSMIEQFEALLQKT
jgi:glycosyltransferase involved in cell wall biosynthesis